MFPLDLMFLPDRSCFKLVDELLNRLMCVSYSMSLYGVEKVSMRVGLWFSGAMGICIRGDGFSVDKGRGCHIKVGKARWHLWACKEKALQEGSAHILSPEPT